MAAVRTMIAGTAPHAILIAGPASVGKTTLALDLAAGLMCTAPHSADRPCRACRGCRLVEDGNHPDVHRLGPEGPGGQVRIGDDRHRGVRDLVRELALLPVEGGARLAIVDAAHRMNDEAQNAILKTLEEPPAGVTIMLCVDDEDRLVPTIRSRCARLRLGPVGARDIEGLLVERDAADPPTAARLARFAAGRPGLALAYARAPEAVTLRAEISRTLLDLAGEARAARLAGVRGLVVRAGELSAALAAAAEPDPEPDASRRPSRRKGASRRAAEPELAAAADGRVVGDGATADEAGQQDEAAGPVKAPASERRRAALALLDLWRDVARDLALVASGSRTGLRDPGLLDELEAAAARHPHPGPFLARLARAALLVEENASPELVLDVLALAWSDGLVAA